FRFFLSGDGAGADAPGARAVLRRLRQSEVQRAASGGRRAVMRSQRPVHVYVGSRAADSVSEVGAPWSARILAGGPQASCLRVTSSEDARWSPGESARILAGGPRASCAH